MQNRTTSFVLFVRFPLITMILLLLGMGTFSRRGFMDWRRISSQNALLQQKIEAALLQKEDLLQAVHALDHDQTEQERVVRSVLGYVKANETVIEFE